MMRILLLIITLLIMTIKETAAQQDPRYTLFNYNYAIVNPAAVGSKEKLSFVALHRQQWVGFGNGAPYTSTMSLDMPVFKLRSGIGINVISDHHGILQNNSASLSYAVIAHTSDYGRLSLGVNVGFNQNRANFGDVHTDPNNTNITMDPNFNYGQSLTRFSPSAGFGLYYYDRVFKLGFSMPIVNPYSYYTIQEGGSKTNHAFVTTGVNLILNDRIRYNPRVLIKLTPGAPLQAEINNQFIFDKLAVGVSFRSGESVSGIVSYTVHPQLNFSYAYDLVVLNGLRNSQYGSHEIGLNYIFKFPRLAEGQKVFRIKKKYECIDFDHPAKKRFFKHLDDLFYDRN